MKFTTFRSLVRAGAGLLTIAVLGGVGLCGKRALDVRHAESVAEEQAAAAEARAEQRRQEQENADRERRADAARAASAEQQALAARLLKENPAAAYAGAPGLSASDVDVLAALARPVVDKVKDATAGKPWKVNVYADPPAPGAPKRWTRAKVDLDRDGGWDETWTLKAGVTKQVAARGEANSAQTLTLDLQRGWLDPHAAAPAAKPVASGPADALPGALSEADQAVLELVKALPPQEKIKDATKGRAFKVNLYSEDGAAWARAKVDLDRDDKWDETWTFPSGNIAAPEKKVAAADDESYGSAVVLVNGRWTPKP